MNKYISRALLGTSAASLFALSSCNDDESVDALIGDWEVTITEEDGPKRASGDPQDYTILFSFTAAGNFEFCYRFVYSELTRTDETGYEYCSYGDYEKSKDGDVTVIDIDFGVDFFFDSIELTTLTAAEIEGDIVDIDTEGEETHEYRTSFTAVKVD